MVVRKASWILALFVAAAGPFHVTAQVRRACMGIMINPDPDGVIIVDVSANGPADRAWLRAGDVIEGIIIGERDDRPVRTIPELTHLVSQLLPGDTVMVRYRRSNKQRMTRVTLRPEPMADRMIRN
jgi:S1-C subfamily serine protease